tara:strand:+ start:7612 stop:8358 length:747 start_codon:yes stop_codon:yes gene_type:complete
MKSDNKKIVKSFKVQEVLNPDIWEEYGESYKMNPEIRDSLLKIVEDYLDFVDIDVDVDDITLTGSLSNYNWSDFSDVDLHILIDTPKEKNSLLKKYLDSRRIIWNSLRDVKVKDFDVEVYVQDTNEPHFASGVYSVMYDDWLSEPNYTEFNLEPEKILKKSQLWMEKIDKIEDDAKRKEPQVVLDDIQTLKDKLKTYRGTGLKDEGEYSYENLTFKFLRRNGYIGKLHDIKNKLIDKTLTVEEKVFDI